MIPVGEDQQQFTRPDSFSHNFVMILGFWGETESIWYQPRIIDDYGAVGGMRIGR
jgi:hypothetical protein